MFHTDSVSLAVIKSSDQLQKLNLQLHFWLVVNLLDNYYSSRIYLAIFGRFRTHSTQLNTSVLPRIVTTNYGNVICSETKRIENE